MYVLFNVILEIINIYLISYYYLIFTNQCDCIFALLRKALCALIYASKLFMHRFVIDLSI